MNYVAIILSLFLLWSCASNEKSSPKEKAPENIISCKVKKMRGVSQRELLQRSLLQKVMTENGISESIENFEQRISCELLDSHWIRLSVQHDKTYVGMDILKSWVAQVNSQNLAEIKLLIIQQKKIIEIEEKQLLYLKESQYADTLFLASIPESEKRKFMKPLIKAQSRLTESQRELENLEAALKNQKGTLDSLTWD